MMRLIQKFTLIVAFGCMAAFADTGARPAVTPIQAELMGDVQAHLLQVGSTVYARVTSIGEVKIASW